MSLIEEVKQQLVQLLAKRAEIDEAIVRGRAMLEALRAQKARCDDTEKAEDVPDA